MDSVNERTNWFTDIAFTDENGDAVIPTSASYRIDDFQGGLEVHADTDITELAASVRIMWETSDTAILDETQPYETRVMTVSWTYLSAVSPGLEAGGHAEYLVRVKNLAGATSPSPA